MTKRGVVSLLTGLALVAAAGVSSAAVEASGTSTDWMQSSREGPSHNRHKWWKDERFKAELGLTVQQAQEVEQIFEATLPRLRLGKQQLDQLEADLSKMIRERTADEPSVALQIERVEAARAELNKTRTLMHYRMYRVLSHEQNAKLRVMNERERPDRKENHQ
jgi:Spy/CpxP family protein refolding chaperone